MWKLIKDELYEIAVVVPLVAFLSITAVMLAILAFEVS